MLHIILAGFCLLQFQETYSSYCHCCKSPNYAFCNPVSQNTVQGNVFCYKQPKETVAIFHQKPFPCYETCEWKQYNFTAPLISENPSVMPPGSSTDVEMKPTPQDPGTMMMDSKGKMPSMNPFPMMPTEMGGSAAPNPTPIPPVNMGGTAEPPPTMIPMNTEGTQPTSPMMFPPMRMEEGMPMRMEGEPLNPNTMPMRMEGEPSNPNTMPVGMGGEPSNPNTMPVGMEGGPSNPNTMPVGMGGEPLNPNTMPVGMEGGPSNPNTMPVGMEGGPSNPNTMPVGMEGGPSNPNTMPVGMEGDNSSPRPLPMSPVCTGGLTFILCPIIPDGNNLPFNPTPIIPTTEEGTPPPMETINMENANSKQKTIEEVSKLGPVGSAPSSPQIIPMEGEMPQSVSMSADPMAIKEGTQPNTMQVDVMMMEEGAGSPLMPTDPNSTGKETSQPKPSPAVPVGMDGGDPTSINKPMEMEIVSSQPINIDCRTPSTTVLPICEAYDASYLSPVIESCNTPCKHLASVIPYKHKTILENEKSIPCCTAIDNSCYQCICSPTHSTIELKPPLTHTETSLKYIKPVYEEIVHHVPVLKNVVKNRIVETTRHIPVVDKHLVEEQHKIISHIPVIKKCIRDVIEYRAKHIPVLRHRSRIIEEPCVGHIAHTEHVARPVIETVIRKVPVVFSKKTPVIHHRVRHIPVTETRCHPVIEETVTTMPVRQRILKNVVQEQIRTVIGPWTNCVSSGLSTGAFYDRSTLHPSSGSLYQSIH